MTCTGLELNVELHFPPSGCFTNLADDVTMESCEYEGLTAADNGVCYNGTAVYAIYDEYLARDNGIRATPPAQEYFE